MTVPSFNRVNVSISALCHNYRLLQNRAGEKTTLLAMVKADAYGHGMLRVGRALNAAGCRCFGVAEICEAVALREAGVQGEILVFLGFSPGSAALFFDHDLTPVIFDIASARVLSQEAVRRGSEIAVHVKVDCGMTRLGIYPEEFAGFMAELSALPGVTARGIASHFPRADEADSGNTPEQFKRFRKLAPVAGSDSELLRHTANSGAILNFPETCCDMARAGISLYGYYPDGIAGQHAEEGEKLQAVMSFSSQVLQVKDVAEGVGVSYGHSFITSRPTRLAVLPLGYEDGLSRSLSSRAEVLVRGRRARVCGRICMNLCMVDVTDIEGVAAGDEVVILGRQGGECISADEIAGWMGSISYEVLCLFGNNNERKYIE